MTLVNARAFVKDHPGYTAWRLPLWGPDVWSVTLKSKKELPDGAIVDAPPKAEEPMQLGGLFS
jgi:hypothetical protein